MTGNFEGVAMKDFKGPGKHDVCSQGVTLAQLVKASVGQADVQRFEPHPGHN